MSKTKWHYLLPLIIILLAGCRDQYQDARDQCAKDYPKTVDYIQCVNKVNAQEQEDNDDAALISTTIAISAATSVQ